MKAKLLPLSLACLLGATGFFIGRGTNDGAAKLAENEQGSLAASSRSARDSGSSSASTGASRTSSHDASAAGKNAINSSWTTGDPLERLARFSELTDPLERSRAWLQFIDSLTPEQFEAVMSDFRAKGMNRENMGEYSMLLSAWAKVNPLAALDFATKHTSNPFARQTILATWAQTDPEAAIQWARANHKGDDANPWMVGVIRGLAYQNTSLAETLLKEMPRSRERGDALDAVLPALLKQGKETARSWAAAITDAALRDGAMMRLSERTMDEDPEGTADWLVANPSEATLRNMDDSIYRLARKDKAAAMNFFQDLPPGENRSNALRGNVNALASEDPQAAARLMDTHRSDVNDRMVEQFVYHSFRTDPQVAVSQIGNLKDSDQRERMYSRSIEWWMERDQKAAFDWMSKNQLPQNVVDRLNRVYQGMQRQQN